jgi:hypothetical protein
LNPADAAGRTRAPWHLWLVGGLAVLKSGLGCFDYVMMQTQGEAWLARMEPTQIQIDWFHALPAWYDASWAIFVWGGLFGGLLLLMRRRWAAPLFALSLLGWAAGAVYLFALSNGMEVMGPWWPIHLVHAGTAAGFLWYAWIMGRKGVLR